jgi:hypothetical protein
VARTPRTARLALALIAALAVALIAAPAAMAADGIGLMGRVTDLQITLFCFGVILFFPALVITLSLVQGRLERRKEQRRYDLERLS